MRFLACAVTLLLCLAWLLAGGATRAWAEDWIESEDGNWAYTLDDESNATIEAYWGTDSTVVVPPDYEHGTLDGHPVVGIALGAFAYDEVIEEVWIYDPVGLSPGAFGACTSLKEVHFMSDGITDIPSTCFYGCSSLTSIEIPGNVTNIGQGAFWGCTSLEDVSFMAGSEQRALSISARAFQSCTSLTEIVLPPTLDVLEREAFLDCSALEAIVFEGGPSQVDPQAFSGCDSIHTLITSTEFILDWDLELPKEAAMLKFHLDDYGYAKIAGNDYYRDDVTVVHIPSKVGDHEVHSILHNGFNNYGNLKSVVFPDDCHVEAIESGAFWHCKSLESITIPASVTTMGEECFKGCTSLKEVTFETDSLTAIPTSAFEECDDLKAVTIPEGVTSIGARAFGMCGHLSEVRLPSTLSTIEKEVFAGCSDLRDIYMPDTDKDSTLFENAFLGLHKSDLTFHVRWGSSAWDWLRGDNPHMVESKVVFERIPLDDESVKVTVNGSPTYNTAPCYPDVTVTRFGHVVPSEDYLFVADNGRQTNAGPATVTIYSDTFMFASEHFSGSRDIDFTINPASLSDDTTMEIKDTCTWDTKEWKPDCIFRHTFPSGAIYTFGSDEYTLKYANNTNAGKDTATVTLTVKDGGNFKKGSKVFTFSINKRDLSAEDVTVDGLESYYPFTGDYVTPVPRVTIPGRNEGDDPIVLEAKWGDYDISYENNVRWGTASLTIEGKDPNTFGSVTVPFEIRYPLGPDITISDIPDQTYTGEAIVPKVTVSAFGSVLPESSYEVIALGGENVDVGVGRAVVRGRQAEWTASKEFNIVARHVTVTADDVSKVYGSSDPELTATVSNVVPAQAVAYTLSREPGEDEGSYAITATGDEDQGNYLVSFEDGTFTIEGIKFEDAAEVAEVPDQTYCGRAIEPSLSVTRRDTGAALVKGEDYEVTYADNEDVGTATVTVTGLGHLHGSIHTTFKIVPRDLSDANLTFAQPSIEWWGGEPRCLYPTVTLDGVQLKEQHDYQVSFADHSEVGTAKVTVSGTGNYTGSTEATYEIVPYRITVLPGDASKSFGEEDPALTATLDRAPWGSDVVDYALSREPGEDAGTYAITVSGERRQGSYEIVTDEKATFTIERLDIHEIGVTVSAPDVTYDGTEHKPIPVVMHGDAELEYGKDFEIEGYSYNQHAGTAYVVVHGIGNYKGWKQGTFTILPKPAEVSANDCSKCYGDEDPEFTATERGVVEGDRLYYGFEREPGEDQGAYLIYPVEEQRNYDYDVSYYPGALAIQHASITDATVACEDQTYSGVALEPVPTVRLGDRELSLGTDFQVRGYEDNVDAGTATVTVVGAGNYGDLASGTFEIAPLDISGDACSVGVPIQEYTGGQLTPDPSLVQLVVKDKTLTLEQGVDYEVSGYGENIQNSGTVQIRGIGNFTGENEGAFRIVNSHNLELASVSDIPDQVFTGSAIEPDFTVSLADVDLLLRPGVDYAVTYENNQNVGTAKVTITGIAPITGSLTTTFKITSASLDAATVTAEDQTYGGVALTPDVHVSLGDLVLVADEDYTVTAYEDNVDVGTAKVTVTGCGNYAGMASGTFEVAPRDVTVTAKDLSKTYGAAEPKLAATVRGLVGSDTISYSLSREAGEDVGSYAISATGEEAQGNYHVTFVDGTFTINPADISSATVTCDDQTYSGSALEPVPTVTLGTTELVAGRDFEVTGYEDNVDAGTAKVTVSGKGNYEGVASGKITIVPLDISSGGCEVRSGIQLYTGDELEPVPLVEAVNSDGRKMALELGRDFVITGYQDNVVGPVGIVSVEGVGNFTGANSGSFTIVSDSDLTLGEVEPIDDQPYTGSPVEPRAKVSLRGVDLLIREGVDYTVSYEDNVDVGVATVTVTGVGAITGTLSTTFRIVPADISSAVVTAEDQTYTGSVLEPAPTVMLGGSTVPASDYTVSYEDNVNVGAADIIVTATGGNCTGSASGTFQIAPRDISGNGCEVTVGAQEYTGSQLTPDPLLVQMTVGEAALTLEKGVDYEVTGYGENVKGSGTVRIRGIGNFTGTNEGSFSIVDSTDLTQGSIKAIPSQVFTGYAIEPDLVVRIDGLDLVLRRDVDYTATFENNVDVGTATVTVEGIAPFTGTLQTTFKIVPKALSGAKVTAEAQVYTGSELTPTPTVTLGGTQLAAGIDFEVSTYENNVLPGTAVIEVRGIGNYFGRASGTFEIGRRPLSGNVTVSTPEDVTYNGARQKPAVTVTDGDAVLRPTVDYSLVYGNNLGVGTASVSVIGRGNYEGKETVTFSILPKDVTVTANDLGKVYGTTDPELTATVEGVVDRYVVRYDLAREQGEDVGQYAIHATGEAEQGNYSVTFVDGAFTVRRASIAGVEVAVEDQAYAGRALEPEVRVKLGEEILSPGRDFTVRYLNNVHAGKATAVVSGMGNYVGTASGFFQIEKGQLVASYTGESIAWDGAPSLAVEVKGFVDGEDEETAAGYQRPVVSAPQALEPGKSYELVPSGGAARDYGFSYVAGTLSVGLRPVSEDPVAVTGLLYMGSEQVGVIAREGFSVTGGVATDAGAYVAEAALDKGWSWTDGSTGQRVLRWSIAPVRISATSHDDIPDQTHTGSPCEPAVLLRYGDAVLLEGKDYEVTYADNVELGEARAIVSGLGNFEGALEVPFSIVEASYVLVSGPSEPVVRGEAATFTFERVGDGEATFSHFTGVRVDGKKLSAAAYDVKSGSVVITLRPDYTKTLQTGEHTLTALFDDGSAEASFTLKDSGKRPVPVIPQTGDTMVRTWVVVAIASLGAGAVLVGNYLRRKP